jgi:AraC-like DNA-binding protein
VIEVQRDMVERAGFGSGGDVPAVAFSKFCTDALSPEEGLELWRNSIAPMFDSRPERPGERFFGSIDACLFDSLVLARSRAAAQQFRRDRRMQRRDGLDHYVVQHYLRGGYEGEHAGREIRVRPGDTSILDLGAETCTRDRDFECFTLIVPRDRLGPLVKGTDCSGLKIRGESALGRILASHLAGTWGILPDLRGSEAQHVAQATLGVLAAAIGAQAGGAGVRRDPCLEKATALAVRDYIERHLDRVDLDPEHLCRVFRCSRSYLYRLFGPEGGVAHYIQRRRLGRCYRELTQTAGSAPRVGEIAGRWGFTNPSHFSRLFREVYGRSPRDAMRQPGAALASDGAAGDCPRADLPAYHDWLLRLRRSPSGTRSKK